MPLVLSAIACGLFMHHSLGCAAIDSLAAIGIMDPKLGVTLLLTILFFNNIFSSKGIGFHDMLVSSLVGSFSSFLMRFRQCLLPFPFVYAIYLYFLIRILKTVTAETFGNAPIACFSFCHDSSCSSDHLTNASQECRTVCLCTLHPIFVFIL